MAAEAGTVSAAIQPPFFRDRCHRRFDGGAGRVAAGDGLPRRGRSTPFARRLDYQKQCRLAIQTSWARAVRLTFLADANLFEPGGVGGHFLGAAWELVHFEKIRKNVGVVGLTQLARLVRGHSLGHLIEQIRQRHPIPGRYKFVTD